MTYEAAIVPAVLLYAMTCGALGSRPDAPIWLRWPLPVWGFIRAGGPAPKQPPRPDYRKIQQLERELGIAEPESEPAPEPGIRRGRTVCLVKNCCGDTEEIRTWSGMLVMRVHHCE